MTAHKRKKGLVEWKVWDKNNLPKGVILVMFMNSKVFPIGAVVQVSVDEVLCGVIGDKNPTYWKELKSP